MHGLATRKRNKAAYGYAYFGKRRAAVARSAAGVELVRSFSPELADTWDHLVPV
jgi:hypothetical protein